MTGDSIMKMITKLAGAALALCIAGSQYTGGAAELPPAAGLYQAFTTTGDSLYHPFAVGPGVINLSPADSLADRQWALRNNGRIRRTESRLNLDSLDHMYVHKDDGGDVDAVALPPVGPGNYDKINTDAVEGIDINILPAWDLYETVETKRPVTVAIIDTGIDITHPDLKNAIWTNEDEIPDAGISMTVTIRSTPARTTLMEPTPRAPSARAGATAEWSASRITNM